MAAKQSKQVMIYDARQKCNKGDNMPKESFLPRNLYRQIKSMSRDAMEKTLNNIYEMGAKEALANAVIDLNMDKLRSEIGSVNGIGDKRLEQIMEIIQRNIAEGDNKKCKNSN